MELGGIEPSCVDVLQTLSGTTDDDASVRLWSECTTAHGITFAPSRSEDGGLEFSGQTEEATQIAVDECQAALIQAGLAQP